VKSVGRRVTGVEKTQRGLSEVVDLSRAMKKLWFERSLARNPNPSLDSITHMEDSMRTGQTVNTRLLFE
jgi:hypothetical protein